MITVEPVEPVEPGETGYDGSTPADDSTEVVLAAGTVPAAFLARRSMPWEPRS